MSLLPVAGLGGGAAAVAVALAVCALTFFLFARRPTPLSETARRVAPSLNGFLPAAVPCFEFGGELDRVVEIADAVPPMYARADPPAFRAWLADRAAALDGPALLAQINALGGGDATRCALVPLVFLAHVHRWGATSPPAWVLAEGTEGGGAVPALPHPLSAALDALRRPLGLQVSGSISVLFLWNWRLVDDSRGTRPKRRLPGPGEAYDATVHLSVATVAPRFRFCDGDLARAEAAVLHSVLLTEAAGTGAHRALVSLFDAAEAAEDAGREDAAALKRALAGGAAARLAFALRRALPWSPAAQAARAADAAADAAAAVWSSLKAALAVFHAVFSQAAIPISAWAFHIQPTLCAVAPGDHGVGGAQMPWVHATDAAFGIDQAGDALGGVVASNAACLLPEERLFVAYCAAHGVPLRRWLAAKAGGGPGPAGRPGAWWWRASGPLAPLPDLAAPARAHFSAALAALVAWRATHRARAAAYLAPPGAPARATTGGTAAYGRAGAGVDGDAAVRADFNKLMDARIASTRRAGAALTKAGGTAAAPAAMAVVVDAGGGGGGAAGGPAMADMFPEM